jgi:hypothetical protein
MASIRPAVTHAATLYWDVESDEDYCVGGFVLFACTAATSSVTAYTVTANASTHSGTTATQFTPDSMQLGCTRFLTDASGIRREEVGVVNANPYLHSGTVSGFMIVGPASAIALGENARSISASWANLRATDTSGNYATAWGNQYYDNLTDVILYGTVNVHYAGRVLKYHLAGSTWISDGVGYDSLYCTTQGLSTTLVTGEAELEAAIG